MNRILALDVGDRRIGISMTDPMQIIASPFSVIDRKVSKNVYNEITDIVKNYSIETIVVGMPITLKGKNSHQTNAVKEFIDELSRKTSANIETVDV